MNGTLERATSGDARNANPFTGIGQGLENVFTPNKAFKRKYDELYNENPLMANLFLLMCELADENGQLRSTIDELFVLAVARFNDPNEYAL